MLVRSTAGALSTHRPKVASSEAAVGRSERGSVASACTRAWARARGVGVQQQGHKRCRDECSAEHAWRLSKPDGQLSQVKAVAMSRKHYALAFLEKPGVCGQNYVGARRPAAC